MASLDIVHRRLLDEWQQEAKRDLSRIQTILKSTNMEIGHKKLMAVWNKEPKDLEAIGDALEQLKELMDSGDAMQGFSHNALLTIHRNFYEIRVLYSILICDLDLFHEAISILLNFYDSSKENWPNKWLMVGLNLMYLLATNQHAHFHMLLEQIDQNVQQNNAYITVPVQLEQSLMEGAYSKVMLTEKIIPSPYYSFFIRISMNAIRDEIASCMECAFMKISQQDAARLLLFNDDNDVIPYAEKRGWKSFHGCGSQGVTYMFEYFQPSYQKQRELLDTKRITKQAIFYAKQLEMIV